MEHYYNYLGKRISKQEAIKELMEYWMAHVLVNDDIVIVDPEKDYENLKNTERKF